MCTRELHGRELRGHACAAAVRGDWSEGATGAWDPIGEGRNNRFLPNATEMVSSLIGTRDDFVSLLRNGFYIFFSSLSVINLLLLLQFA
jgi:hypothetical protein